MKLNEYLTQLYFFSIFPFFESGLYSVITYIPKCKTLSNYSYVILLYDHEIKTLLDLNPIFHWIHEFNLIENRNTWHFIIQFKQTSQKDKP